MNVFKPHQRTTVATLLEAGASQRQIGRLTGIDRKTIRAVQLGLAAERSNSPGVATGSAPQTPPPRPPAPTPTSVSACEPHRAFIEAQLRLKRNFMSIYQDLVDQHGFAGAYNSVKRFAGGLRERQPEQFDCLEFAPGEEAQVDYGEGALTRIAGTERYRKPRLFVMTLTVWPTSAASTSKTVPLRLTVWSRCTRRLASNRNSASKSRSGSGRRGARARTRS